MVYPERLVSFNLYGGDPMYLFFGLIFVGFLVICGLVAYDSIVELREGKIQNERFAEDMQLMFLMMTAEEIENMGDIPYDGQEWDG